MIAFLMVTAILLGSLAFFEPCTIATHTLYTVRSHQQRRMTCHMCLLSLWLSRTLLITGLLVASVALTEPPQWSPYLPSIILAVMAALYIVSRYTYIPVPHLEFYRLVPGQQYFSHNVKLGLTIPACTIPLVIIVVGISITLDSIYYALLAGILFATLFSLPTFILAITGVESRAQKHLQNAANVSPYLTAILLIGTAMYLLLINTEINPQILTTRLQQASWAGIGLSFLTGFVFSFNPVSFASIPVVLAYVTKAHAEKRAVIIGAAFVSGMIVTHVVLGVGAATGGSWAKDILGREWAAVLGPVLILLGLIWPGWLKLRLPWFSARGFHANGMLGAFLLAIPFSIAVCPFCTPALVVTLAASAAIGSVSFGFALLLAFALGRSIPIIVGAWSMGWLESLQGLTQHQKIFETIAGIILIITGIYMLNEYFYFIKY